MKRAARTPNHGATLGRLQAALHAAGALTCPVAGSGATVSPMGLSSTTMYSKRLKTFSPAYRNGEKRVSSSRLLGREQQGGAQSRGGAEPGHRTVSAYGWGGQEGAGLRWDWRDKAASYRWRAWYLMAATDGPLCRP